MDPIPSPNVNEIDPDLNRIKDLSLEEGHNHKLDLGVDSELKKQSKTSFVEDGSMSLKPNPAGNLPCWSPTSSCMCRGQGLYYPVEPYTPWASPDPKLYWAAEDPTRKEYSPFAGPRETTSFSVSNLKKLYANFNFN